MKIFRHFSSAIDVNDFKLIYPGDKLESLE